VTTKERAHHAAEGRMIHMRVRRKVWVEHTLDRLWMLGTAPRRVRERIAYYRWRVHLAREEFGGWLAVVLARPRKLLAGRRFLPAFTALVALLAVAGATFAIVTGGSGDEPGKIQPARALTPQPAPALGAAVRERAAKAAERARDDKARKARAAARERAAARRRAAAARRRAAAERRHKAAPAVPQVAAKPPKAAAPAKPSPAPRSTPQPVSKPAPAPARPAPAAPAPKSPPKGVAFDDES
jgi:hypothetical protein